MKNHIYILLVFASSALLAQPVKIEEKVKYLALGDSYTIGQSVSYADRWPSQLIDSLRHRGLECYDPKFIATTGWRTDDLKHAIVDAKLKNEYNLVSLLIGVNNYYQGYSVGGYESEFGDLLSLSIQLAGGDASRVFVVSIPDYGYTPFGASQQPTISKGIDAFNTVAERICAQLGVHYFYITTISRNGLTDPSLVANDGLHPSGKQYTEWVKVILSDVTLIKKDTSVVTGAEERDNDFSAYPNPFEKNLTIRIPTADSEVTIRLVNELGVSILNETVFVVDHQATISTAQLSPGFYIYRLTGKTRTESGKLIKN